MHRKAFAVESSAKKVLSRESRIVTVAIYILAVHKETFDLHGIKFKNNRIQKSSLQILPKTIQSSESYHG